MSTQDSQLSNIVNCNEYIVSLYVEHNLLGMFVWGANRAS